MRTLFLLFIFIFFAGNTYCQDTKITGKPFLILQLRWDSVPDLYTPTSLSLIYFIGKKNYRKVRC